MVLYHAISAFQILTVCVHKLRYHNNEKSIIVMPDFIVSKYENYKKILCIFDEVYLFPYMSIEHNKETVLKKTEEFYKKNIPYKLESFNDIYIAGAHFYFSLLLINKNIHFYVFEDATGMYNQHRRLYNNMMKTYPIHAEIMEEVKMFSLDQPLIIKILCDKKANNIKGYKRRLKDWNTMRDYQKLDSSQKNCINYFFVDTIRYYDVRNSVLIITQNFIGLGSMNVKEQEEIFLRLKKKLYGKKIIIKVHPDDNCAYQDIFRDALIIREKIPIELMFLYFVGKPDYILAFSTASDLMFMKCKVINFAKEYSSLYDYDREYSSITKILDAWK